MPSTLPWTVETLEAKASELSGPERGQLIERLILALEPDPEIEDAWAAEVARRDAEIDEGKADWMPGPEALGLLRDRYR